MPYKKSIVDRKLIRTGDGNFPTKLYILRSYAERLKNLDYATQLLQRTLIEGKKGPEIMDKPHQFAIALAFGLDGDYNESPEGIDIFSARFGDGEEWSDVSMYDSWTFEDGVFVPRDKGTTCGVGAIILGKEEELRMVTTDIDQFLDNWPFLDNLYDADFLKNRTKN